MERDVKAALASPKVPKTQNGTVQSKSCLQGLKGPVVEDIERALRKMV
jgi:hypothetical protein